MEIWERMIEGLSVEVAGEAGADGDGRVQVEVVSVLLGVTTSGF